MRYGRLITGALSCVLVGGVDANAQAPARVGKLVKASLEAATREAKKWRGDGYLFQVSGSRITDGIAMWDYDFFSAGAGTEKCLRVSFGKNDKAYTSRHECDVKGNDPLKDFAVDSDRAVDIARKAGLKKPQLSLVLSAAALAKKPIWTVMEGTSPGDQILEIDATSGAVLLKSKM